MNEHVQALCNYLDAAHSVYHAVAYLARELDAKGYIRLDEGSAWNLTAGGKYYLIRGGTAMVAFRIPQTTPRGFLMSASHSDRPTFKLKEDGELESRYIRWATEKYGGMLMASWLDRPLSVAGRVLVETEQGVQAKLIDIDRDLMLMPNVAIHMNRQVNEGYAYNPRFDTIPLLGSASVKGGFVKLLEQAAGGKILGQDLYVYLRQKTCVWGLGEEYISGPGLDDLQCVWSCTQGFLHSQESGSVPVLCVFDCEEVGSNSAQGAAGTLLSDTLERICDGFGWTLKQMLHHSFLVSADNGHAMHPNHPELADVANSPVINGGLVLKFNATLRYCTDGVAAAVVRKICQKAGVPTQTYCNRADIPGGSTLGNISLHHVSVPTADLGLAQLAMHSCYETAGVRDGLYMTRAMQTYFSSTLTVTPDGAYLLD